jgi:DNA-binding CsgD family transcriptional regulator
MKALTPRELDVLRLAKTGSTNAAIGENLGIAIGTVKIHLGHAFRKLSIKDKRQLIAECIARQSKQECASTPEKSILTVSNTLGVKLSV